MKNQFIALTFIVLLVAGCIPAQDTQVQQHSFIGSDALAPRTFESEEELKAFITQYQAGGRDYYYSGNGMLRATASMDVAESAPAMPVAVDQAKEEDSASSGSTQYSGTNNQVVDVDEADIIKTDGEYIYTASGETLFIIKAYPGADAAVVATIDLPGYPSGLFIDGDSLAVFGNFYDNDYFKEHDFRPVNGMTYLNLYDLSDKENPEIADEFKLEGGYSNARLLDGTIYFIVESLPNLYYPMPVIFEGDVLRTVAVSDISYFPMPYDYPQFTTVHALPIAGGELRSRTITVESGNTLYMSPENIYLATTKYINEYEIRNEILVDVLDSRLSAAEQNKISKIKAADPDVLNQAEKDAKVLRVYEEHFQFLRSDEQEELNDVIDERLKEELDQYEAMEYTVVHKIAVADLAVVASGEVPGRLNNQFAMDEDGDYLRIATTISERWNWWGEPVPMPVDIDGGIGDSSGSAGSVPAEGAEAPVADTPVASDAKVAETTIAPDERRFAPPRTSNSRNNVYVLDEDLAVVGELENIAEGEQIYSTRFIADRLYMVTFRQVDPFFVIDLSNPEAPTVLGELKIPGFSRYLHPYDENTVIGIGRDATATGRTQGLKISLFDVSNVAKPTELANWISEEEYAQSTAEYEHKAFLFDREKELLVIPAYSYEWDYAGGNKEHYNGAMVFHIQRDDIEMRGVIDHSSGKQDYWGSLVERSLYIEELLYTKSPGLLRINEIDDLNSVQNITLTGKNSSPYPIY